MDCTAHHRLSVRLPQRLKTTHNPFGHFESAGRMRSCLSECGALDGACQALTPLAIWWGLPLPCRGAPSLRTLKLSERPAHSIILTRI